MLPNLFEYVDYRSYLRVVYDYQKANQKRYSFAKMSEELGLGDRAFLQHILRKKCHLPNSALAGVVQGLKFDTEAAAYFELLVQLAKTRQADEKEKIWKEVRKRSLNSNREVQLPNQRTEILERWFAFPLKELLCLGMRDVQAICQAFKFKVTPVEIRDTIEDLIRLEFVEINSDGDFVDLSPDISAPTQEEFAEVVRKYQGDSMLLGREAVNLIPPVEREISTLTMSLSEKTFVEGVQILREARDKLIELHDQDQANKNKVFQVNLNLFPVAQLPNEQSDKEG